MNLKIDGKKLCANFSIHKPKADKMSLIFEIENEDDNNDPIEGMFSDWQEFNNFKDFLLYIIKNSEVIKEAVENEYPQYRMHIKVGDDSVNHLIFEGNGDVFSNLNCFILIDNLLSNNSKKLIDKINRIEKIIHSK